MPPSEPSKFTDFGLDERLVAAVEALGFDEPTPIQTQAIPDLLGGRDIIGRARTGSGKTAAFGLPLLDHVKDGAANVQALVLTPTRELAVQVTEALRSYAAKLPVRLVTVYGGVAYGPQLAALRRGVSVVVGTPGRVLDHMRKGTLDISALQLLVLDEADEMLRMGFIEDVEEVLAQSPPERQVALFSATLPPPIRTIAKKYLRKPIEVQVEQRAHTTVHITQRWLVVPQAHKIDALARVLAEQPRGATLIFARTRAGCAEAATALAARGLAVDALHGDLNQSARELVLNRLRNGRLDTVVATDVAARGLDVEHLTHVVNLDLPSDLDSYVHRIGRTGRAGRAGLATSLVTPAERGKLNHFARVLDTPLVQTQVPSDLDIAQRQQSYLLEEVERLLAAPPSPVVAEMTAKLLEVAGPESTVGALLGALAQAHGVPVNSMASAKPPAWARKQKRDAPDKRGAGERWQAGKGRPGRKPRGEAAGPGPRRASDKRPSDKERRGGPKRATPRGQAEGPKGVAARALPPKSAKGRPQRASDRAKGSVPAGELELFLSMGSRRGVRPQDVVGALAGDLGVPSNAIGRITVDRNHTLVCVPKDLGNQLLQGDASLHLRGQWVPLARARDRR